MAVTQSTQVVKKRRSLPAHPFPVFVRVNSAEPVRHGTASAEGNAKIMDCFAIEAVGGFVCFFWDLIHPVDQARVFANWTFGSHSKALYRTT
jgi:hypothetical protein